MTAPQSRQVNQFGWLVNNFAEHVPGVAHAVVVSVDGVLLTSSSRLPAERAEHRAVIRAYGGLVKAAMREWVRDGSLERADVRRLLARVLETIVQDVLPG